MEFSISFIDGYFDVKLADKVDPVGCREYLDHLTAHERWKPGSLVLSDETGVEVTHLTQKDMMALAKVCESRKNAIGAALIAVHVETEFGYGMSRMFQGFLASHWNATVRAFKSRSGALSWLLSEGHSREIPVGCG